MSATQSRPSRARNRAAIAAAAQAESERAADALGLARTPRPEHPSRAALRSGGEASGLTLGDLEERRWSVDPKTARAKLEAAALPVEGRRAGLIYSWRSILLAEGVEAHTAGLATRGTHPELFDDLLDGDAAAARLGVVSSSTVRRMALSGEIPEAAWVAFGRRGVRRFRPALLEPARLRRLRGRLV